MAEPSFSFEPTEDQLVHSLLDALMRAGWMACHFRPARTAKGWRTAIQGHVGFPDIIAAHPARGLLIMEVKTTKGRLRPEQSRWKSVLERISDDGRIMYRVVRPQDWYNGSLDELIGYEDDRDR